VLLGAASAPGTLTGFAPPPGAAPSGALLRLRRTGVGPSDLDSAIDTCAMAKVTASPHYLSTLAAVSKGVGGPEPADPPPPAPVTGAPATGHRDPVRVAIIDTGIPAAERGHTLLGDVPRTDDNVDLLDVLPAGPDGLLDYQAGHGSFVAGVVRRVAPHAEVRMYRAVDSDGFGTDHEIAEAILRAHADGAHIINLSLGVRTDDDQPPPAMADAVATVLRESGGRTVIVAAAGNSGEDVRMYPAALEGVEAVAGLTAYLAPARWSSYGRHVRFSTVGEGVRSTYVPGTESPVFDPEPDTFGPDPWAVWSGTSFAAPQIAGAVARISYEEGVEPRAAVDKLDEYGKPVDGYGKAMRILQGIG
jgi:subtilisin family serine protease